MLANSFSFLSPGLMTSARSGAATLGGGGGGGGDWTLHSLKSLGEFLGMEIRLVYTKK